MEGVDADGYAEITPELKNQMVDFIQERIIRNLEAIQVLLRTGGYDDICAGLYTYAVEEYGKILFLNDPEHIVNNKIRFRHKKVWRENRDYGFLAHGEKFARVLRDRDFPTFSKLLNEEGDYDPADYDPYDYHADLLADMKARMALFYADFKDKYSIEKPPLIDRHVLERAVNKFLDCMRK